MRKIVFLVVAVMALMITGCDDDGEIIEESIPESYLVTFVNPNGLIINVQMVTEGEDATNFTPDMPKGYIFTGWDDDLTNITSNKTFKTEYSKEVYDIVFNTEGYDFTIDDIEDVEYGSFLSLEAEEMIGYKFIGFFTGNSTNDQQLYNGHIVTSDLELFPRYEKEVYTLSYHSNGGTAIPEEEYYYGDMIEYVSSSNRGDLVFENWYYDMEFTNKFDPEQMVTEDIDLYAKWLTLSYVYADLDMDSIRITEYRNDYAHVEIPSHIDLLPVTEIGESVFEGKSLSSIVLPDAIEYIGNYAFKNCENLESIIIGKNVSSMGYGLFEGAESLKSAVILGELSILPSTTFMNTTSLETVSLPDSIETISQKAFYQSGIKSISLPEELVTIDHFAFYESGLVEIVLPESLEYIRMYAFLGTQLTSVFIPDSVRLISHQAFYDCSELEEVNIGSGFTDIGSLSFGESPNLSVIIVSPENPFYSSYENVLYDKEFTTLIYYPEGKEDPEFSIPNSVRTFADSAFINNDFIVKLQVPETLNIYGSDFYGLSSLVMFTLSEGNGGSVRLSVHDGVLYSADKTILYRYPISKPDLSYTTLSETVQIDQNAFKDVVYLEDITLNEGLQFITNRSFHNADAITSIVLPSTVRAIGESAFSEMASLASISLNEGLDSIYDKFLEGSPLVTSLSIPSTVSNFSWQMFDGLADVSIDVSANLNLGTDPNGAIYTVFEHRLLHYPSDATDSDYHVRYDSAGIYCDFDDNDYLTSLTLGSNITTFESQIGPNITNISIYDEDDWLLYIHEDIVELIIEYEVQITIVNGSYYSDQYRLAYPTIAHLIIG